MTRRKDEQAADTTATPAPRVYWSKRHRVYFGKYKLSGRWKNKMIPVNLDTEPKATEWFQLWLLRLEDTGVEPVNNELKPERNPFLDPYIKRLLSGADTVAGRNTIIQLSAPQVAKLLTSESPHIPNMRKVRNLVAIATGCRRGEIGAWRWEDFDLDAPIPVVKVFRQVQFSAVLGKPVFKDPKRNSHRTLPLHPSAVAAMRWWKEHGWLEHVGRQPAAGDAVFPSFAGDFSLSRSAEWFRADLAIAEVPVLFDGKHPFTFHACRRTFMSLLEAESVPREIIGALAGHAGKTVADRHYIAKNLKRFHEAVCRLPLPTALPWLPRDHSSRTPRHAAHVGGEQPRPN